MPNNHGRRSLPVGLFLRDGHVGMRKWGDDEEVEVDASNDIQSVRSNDRYGQITLKGYPFRTNTRLDARQEGDSSSDNLVFGTGIGGYNIKHDSYLGWVRCIEGDWRGADVLLHRKINDCRLAQSSCCGDHD